jgi:hypothetical protein
VLLGLAYLGVTNGLALLRLLPMSDRAKDTEILVLSGRRLKFVGGVQGVVGVCSFPWRSMRASRSSRSAGVNFHLNGRALAL